MAGLGQYFAYLPNDVEAPCFEIEDVAALLPSLSLSLVASTPPTTPPPP